MEPYVDLFIHDLPHYDGLSSTYGDLLIEVDDGSDVSKHLTANQLVQAIGDLRYVQPTAAANFTQNMGFSGGATFANSSNIAFGTGAGSMIGTASNQKIGFWGTTPVVKPAAVADVTGGSTIDAEARTTLNTLLARLRLAGIITT